MFEVKIFKSRTFKDYLFYASQECHLREKQTNKNISTKQLNIIKKIYRILIKKIYFYAIYYNLTLRNKKNIELL